MRIGIDARELQGHATGTGRYLRNLLREWLTGGQDDVFLYFRGTAPPDLDRRHLRLVVREWGGRENGLAWQQWTLPGVAERDSLDVFFSPAYACPLRMAVPRVTAVHDLSFFALPEEFAWLDGTKRRWLVAASVRATAVVLACSEFTHREIVSRFPDAADRIRHVPLGPDDALAPPPEREATRRRLGATGPLLLAVGTLFHRRCLPELLRAVALLRRDFGDLRLEVVGENRTYPYRGFDGLIEELGLGGAARLLGSVDEAGLADRYAAADVAVALSLYEGFGLPALEAMARGVPLVAANRPSLDEIVGDGGRLVDPLDPRAIADAIAEILRDDAMRETLRERGRRRAQHFSWAETARLTRSALAEAAGL